MAVVVIVQCAGVEVAESFWYIVCTGAKAVVGGNVGHCCGAILMAVMQQQVAVCVRCSAEPLLLL